MQVPSYASLWEETPDDSNKFLAPLEFKLTRFNCKMLTLPIFLGYLLSKHGMQGGAASSKRIMLSFINTNHGATLSGAIVTPPLLDHHTPATEATSMQPRQNQSTSS
ncbi:hypothetical protein ISCGN_014365 [Ixodes scapularis]